MASRYEPPPIMKAIERLLVDVERAIGTFFRKYRYELGAVLRRQTMRVFHLANKACRDREMRSRWVSDLVWAVDDLKQCLQTCKHIGATRSFRQFEYLARQIEAVGAQVGGWKQRLSPKTQSAQVDLRAQRGQKLSTRDAFRARANP